MNCTSITNDFLVTNTDRTQLIDMPSKFTSIEANLF